MTGLGAIVLLGKLCACSAGITIIWKHWGDRT